MVQQHGRFERVCVLGSGTRTVTEKARVGAGASAGRMVTLVVLLPHAEAEAGAREAFLDKGRVLMQLEEGTIAETLELGRSRTHYLAREFVDGVSLRRLSAHMRTRGLWLPPAFGCDVAVQLAASVMAVHQKIRKLSPRLAHTSFGATLRTLVVTSTGRVRWVDPFALDDASLPRVSTGDPSGDDVAGLSALLYELLVARKPPRSGDFTEFALVAPSTFRSAIPPAIDEVIARGLGFARPAFHGMGAFADAVGEAASELPHPE